MIHELQPVPPRKTASPEKNILYISDKQKIHEEYPDYLSDESRISSGDASDLIFVHDEFQLVQALKTSFINNLPVTISAGRTGITGGAVPQNGAVLSLDRMNQILRVVYDEETSEWRMIVQPGITLEEIQETLDHYFKETDCDIPDEFKSISDQYIYLPDPTELTAHIGGTVATNASGARSYKYGSTRDHIRSLRVALIDGTVLFIKRGQHILKPNETIRIRSLSGPIEIPAITYRFPDIKSVTGYYMQDKTDLIDLFIGSEGTLGVISEIEIAVQKKSEMILAGVAFFPSEADAVQFVKSAKLSGNVSPAVLEYFDSNALQLLNDHQDELSSIMAIPDSAESAIYFEQETTSDDLETYYEYYDEILNNCNTNMDETWGAMDEDELRKLKLFRHSLPETVNGIIGRRKKEYPEIHKVSTDFAVPDEKFSEMLRSYEEHLNDTDFEYVIFGHIGENHLHINILPKNPDELKQAKQIYKKLVQKVVALGGTISAEHGIGKLKKEFLKEMFSDQEIGEMKKLKLTFDPNNLLGRGNIFEYMLK